MSGREVASGFRVDEVESKSRGLGYDRGYRVVTDGLADSARLQRVTSTVSERRGGAVGPSSNGLGACRYVAFTALAEWVVLLRSWGAVYSGIGDVRTVGVRTIFERHS